MCHLLPNIHRDGPGRCPGAGIEFPAWISLGVLAVKAVVLESFGAPEVLQVKDVPEPEPGYGQVLIKVAGCGVCYHDLLTREGVIRYGVELPLIPGHEIAGEIVEVGPGVSEFQVGDRVCTLIMATCGECEACLKGEDNRCERRIMFGHRNDGGYAEYVVAPARAIAKVPDGISLTEAAILGCGVGTSYRALNVAGVRGGETVLVTGAGGGTGLHTVQLARAFGARVIAATTSEEKVERIKQYGADEVILNPDGSFHQAVRDLTGSGVDVVIDHVGSPVWHSTIRSVKDGGRICFIGQVSGESIDFNPGLIILRAISLIGTKGASAVDLKRVIQLVEMGRVKPVIDDVLPLEEAAEAHRRLAHRRAAGRLVLTP